MRPAPILGTFLQMEPDVQSRSFLSVMVLFIILTPSSLMSQSLESLSSGSSILRMSSMRYMIPRATSVRSFLSSAAASSMRPESRSAFVRTMAASYEVSAIWSRSIQTVS